MELRRNPAGASKKEESEALAAQRKEMKWRRRRIIYANDGCDVMYPGAGTPEGFLAQRMVPTLDTQVDSVFYCTGAATMFSHQAKVGEVYGRYITEGVKGHPVGYGTNIRALAALGTDALALVVEFCHENDLEVFFDHRINDIHDSFIDWELSTWKREHPEYLMGKPEDGRTYPETDPRCRWSALDFEIPEVRDYLVAIIDDVLARYDVDGIQIDYLRNPLFFRPNRVSDPVTAEQVEILTEFQRRVRGLAYTHGTRRGRPILVAVRVPVTKRMCLHVGIDIERWLNEDLVDVLATAVGCMPFTNPMGELVELGHAHDVPVYPTIAGSGRTEQQTLEHWRGAAANFRHAGADGMLLFNTFPSTPQHPHFTELGDPETFARVSKIFAIDQGPIGDGGIAHAIAQSQTLPKALGLAGEALEVTLPVGDDIAGAAAAGRLELSTLRARFEGRAAGDMVEAHLNGDTLESTGEDLESGWVTYAADPSLYRHGNNVLAFRVVDSRETADPIVVTAVELRVSYK